MPVKLSSSTSRVCEHCQATFKTESKTKKYCSVKCSDASRAKRYYNKKTGKKDTTDKRYAAKIKKLANTAFGRYLVSECIRAGTVQILSDSTADDLIQLAYLHRLRSRYSGYEEGKPTGFFHLSHIWPARVVDKKLGCLHHLNLVISPAKFNLQHKGSPAIDSAGKYLNTESLLHEYSVRSNATPEAIFKKIRRLLGKSWTSFVTALTIQTNQREQLLKKLTKAGLKPSDSLSLAELKTLADGRGIGYFAANFAPTDPEEVLLNELERFKEQPVTDNARWFAKKLGEYVEAFNGFHNDASEGVNAELSNWLMHQILAVLHGLPASIPPAHIREQLAALDKHLKHLEQRRIQRIERWGIDEVL
jgi:hypothetical protein